MVEGIRFEWNQLQVKIMDWSAIMGVQLDTHS